MRALATAAALALAVCACGGDDFECTVPDTVDSIDWMRVVGCESDYELLWDERTDSVFSRTRTINWIIDREDENRVYFIDTTTFPLHYAFASAYLEIDGLTPVGTHAEFNILNYRRENRRFVLGKLIHYLDQGLLTLEFSAGDTAGADMIVSAFERIEKHLYDGDQLRYRPVSNDHEQMLPQLESRIPVIRTEDVFAGQTYQPLNQGVGYGTLKFLRLAELGGQPPAPTDLVVLDRVPNDIALVSGIITGEFQTPLAHVNILSKNRGTPNMAMAGAFEDDQLRALEGRLVRLDVTAQSFAIEEAPPAEAQAYWDSLRPSQPLIPDFDESVVDLLAAADAGIADSISIGSKAANLSEMTNAGLPLPDRPFAIPFAFYQQHIDDNALGPVIDQLLADAPSLDPITLQTRLFDLRWQLYRAPMNTTTRDLIIARARAQWGDDLRVRFRSSTNVEDLAEFSGAGLYTSASATVSEGDAAIANAVKTVWASAWNYQAFVERDFYRVDHARVRMGVLVHPAFEDEAANGVAVTINEFAENRPAYYINSQIGEISVTNPTGSAIPEQILYYTWYEEPEYEVITRSSLLGGLAVLRDDELSELADYLGQIHEHFRLLYPPSAEFAMDVEFKLTPERRVVIKQARPLVISSP